ncbi:response regulator transcription factor [Paenarthrobacter nicotinovorans]|uniref:response regulator transcription factor n=1 Tax=Paenarthrobacter nicotinovorans TaxID=29320 RepID=UPI0037F425BA
MTTDAKLWLLLVEDDPALGPLIAELLQPDYYVHVAVDGREGLQQAVARNWDVMVIDRGLPAMDGIALIAALRSKGIATPILVLTAHGAVDEKGRGLDAGANDYMTKPFDAMELAARLRALTRSYRQVPRTIPIGDWELDPANRSIRSLHGFLASLTATESELLLVLSSEPDRVFTREELLMATDSQGELPGVIDTHVHHVRRKTARSIVRTIHGVGYQIGEADD